MIFTIHFGVPLFLETPIYIYIIDVSKASVKLSLPCVYQMHSFRFGTLHSHQPVTLWCYCLRWGLFWWPSFIEELSSRTGNHGNAQFNFTLFPFLPKNVLEACAHSIGYIHVLDSTSVSQKDHCLCRWLGCHSPNISLAHQLLSQTYRISWAMSEVRELTMQQQVAAGEPGRCS